MEEKSTNPGDARSASFWRSLFDDISVAQLIAGALAAVTSMLLASRIGIAGSVIGVAVGSIVSAVASQVYKKFLSASAEKLKDMAPDRTVFARRAAHPRSTDCEKPPVSDAAKTAPEPTMPMHRLEETVAMGLRADVAATGVDSRPVRSPRSQVYADEALARSRAARARKARIQRNAVIVAAVSALAAIALTACVIEAVTAGQGFGVKPDSVFYASHETPAADRDSAPVPDSAPSRTPGDASDPSAPSDESAQEGSSSGETSAQGPSDPAPDDKPAPSEPSAPSQTPPSSPDGASGGSDASQGQGDASQGGTQDFPQGAAPHDASGESPSAAAAGQGADVTAPSSRTMLSNPAFAAW
ncbi:MAG: hypothetical protein Q4B35_01315 [Slackia sp.]|nr:hypothetical protein [Slackia sp.]